MKEKTEKSGVEVQGIELIDLGDAAVETKQPNPIQVVQDTAFSWGRTFFDE